LKSLWFCDTAIGKIGIAEENGELTDILYPGENPDFDYTYKETPLIKEAHKQLSEYFNGERKKFDLPLRIDGPPFQTKVWNALMEIPYGETRSYKDIAVRVGNPSGSRAVGCANGKNRLPIIIPCHRVIAADGTPGGYGGGLNMKKFLLNLEIKHR
jgi:methylated-DNA-[protein]-cysteine S-methyltransferase